MEDNTSRSGSDEQSSHISSLVNKLNRQIQTPGFESGTITRLWAPLNIAQDASRALLRQKVSISRAYHEIQRGAIPSP